MTFSTYLFLFLFLPLTLGGYFALSRVKNPVWQRIFLLLSSLVFVGWAGVYHLVWMLCSAALAYLFARLLGRETEGRRNARRALFVLGVLLQIALLAFCKYYHFFGAYLNDFFFHSETVYRLILPLGISYYTFQQVMLLIRVYQGEVRVGDPLTYALFVSFFPYRASGPIVDYGTMTDQLADENRRRFSSERFSRGLYLLVVGLSKKLVLADTLAVFANNGYGAEGVLSLPVAWATALSYTFQLYFDFSGYSDMATGISLMLGFDLPQNFDSPYKSESCTAFWRRWHMTLGRALTTCVYIPLGGNRRGKARTCLNVFLVMIVSGIWHGEDLTFLLWGAIYGVIMVFERVSMPLLEKIPKALRVLGTFLAVNFLWVLFRAPDFASALNLYRGMFNFSSLSVSGFVSLTADGIVGLPAFAALALVVGMLAASFVTVFCFENAYRKAEGLVLTKKTLFWLVFLFVLSFVHLSRLSTFIYVNF